MNWATFIGIFLRDIRVARRNSLNLIVQTLFQPVLFVYVFGYLMVGSGVVQRNYAQIILPGTAAIVMSMTGIQAITIPLMADFQFTRDIEDRLLAPIQVQWIGVQKIIFGSVLSLIAGVAVVLMGVPLYSGKGVFGFSNLLLLSIVLILVSLVSAAGGLALGCRLTAAHTGYIFPIIIGPMVMFGCAYYPWSALKGFPTVQRLVLLNPLVYASEGVRACLAPEIPHLPLWIILIVLGGVSAVLVALGLFNFQRVAVT